MLDARIQLQKAVITANQLPLVRTCNTPPRCLCLSAHTLRQTSQSVWYTSNPAAHGALEGLRDVAGSLIEELLALQGVRNAYYTPLVPGEQRSYSIPIYRIFCILTKQSEHHQGSGNESTVYQTRIVLTSMGP